jgi:hypothetical protein
MNERKTGITYGSNRRTFVKKVTHRAIVQDHHFAQVRLHRTEVLDIRAIAERAMLAVISCVEVLAFLLEPVDDRVRIFLDAGGENNQLIPFAYFS